MNISEVPISVLGSSYTCHRWILTSTMQSGHGYTHLTMGRLSLLRLTNSRLVNIKSDKNTDISGSKASVLGFTNIL